jgi:hypothetical protein
MGRCPPLEGVSSGQQNDFFTGSPGEWVLYGVANRKLAHYFKLSSVQAFEDKVLYEARFVYDAFDTPPSDSGVSKTGAFEDDTNVLDCKKSTYAGAERTVYNRSGEVLTHFKMGDPKSLDLLSLGVAIAPDPSFRPARTYFVMGWARLSYRRSKSLRWILCISPIPQMDGETFSTDRPQ